MRALLKNVMLWAAPARAVKWARAFGDYLPNSLRYGKHYREALALFRESDGWDEGRLREYQDALLRLLIEHAYSNVPYYRELFRERGLRPEDIRTAQDLTKIPYLTKEIVRERKQDLVAGNIRPVNRDEANTSGSTGSSLTFFMDSTTRPFERAVAFRHLQWLGYKPGDPIAYFRVLPMTYRDRWYTHYRPSNMLRMSFRVVNEQRLEKIVNLLNSFKPVYLSAWPSSLLILAKWMERTGKRVPPLRYLISGSENLYPHVRETVERVFGAPVIDHYGQEESVAVAMQCSYGRGYHVQMEMGILELAHHVDGFMEIVGTCLHNLAMPFIRYRTGDLAIEGGGPCPCGRHHPLLAEIVGREADFVVTPENNVVSPLTLNYLFHNRPEIREGQIIQEDLDLFRIKVVPWKRISEETREGLLRDLRSALESSGIRLIIEEVKDIPRTVGCKKPFVISRVHAAKEL
jgi:phenylacetate-CoA ligase